MKISNPIKSDSNFKFQIVLAVIGLVSLVFGVGTAYAQTRATPTPTQAVGTAQAPTRGLNLTLSPTYISLTTDPGKEVSSQFKIRNNNGFTENLQVTVAKMEVGSDGRPVLRDMTQQDEFGKWINVQDNQFQIGANQSKTIRFSIAPPKDAALGYYYTLLVSRVKTESQAEGAQAVIAGSAGITVLLDVKSPNAKRELQVANFSTDKLFYEYLPTTFTVNVKNTGNVHVIPFGDIFVDSLFHKQIASLPANPGRGNVLPQSSREFNAVWSDGFAVRIPKTENGVPVKDKKGNQVYTTKYDFGQANKFRVGKYTAHLIMVYDNGVRDTAIQATVSFWVIPWKILGVGLVVLIFALVGIKNTLLSYGRKLSRLFGRR